MDSNEKVFGILAYFGWLVLIPILAGKSEFSKFHANQGILLAIAGTAISVLSFVVGFIPFVGLVLRILLYLADVACLVFAIMGIVNAAQEQMKPLPVIGGIKILK